MFAGRSAENSTAARLRRPPSRPDCLLSGPGGIWRKTTTHIQSLLLCLNAALKCRKCGDLWVSERVRACVIKWRHFMVNNGSSTSNRYTSAANLETAAAPSLFQNDVVAALYRLFVLLLHSVLMWPNGSVNIFDCAHAHTGHGNKTNLIACISFYSRAIMAHSSVCARQLWCHFHISPLVWSNYQVRKIICIIKLHVSICSMEIKFNFQPL